MESEWYSSSNYICDLIYTAKSVPVSYFFIEPWEITLRTISCSSVPFLHSHCLLCFLAISVQLRTLYTDKPSGGKTSLKEIGHSSKNCF